MANPFIRCGLCKGNMWPPGQKEHAHHDPLDPRSRLKKKLLTKPTGWNKAAQPRTNSPKAARRTLKPRRRAYGPF